jgi:hypothetical protein
MNTGLQDAYNLAWKLALVTSNRADDALLDTYEVERRPFAQKLLATTDRAFRIVVSENWFAGLLRTHIVPSVAAIAMKRTQVKKAAFLTLSQIGIRYRESSLSQTLGGVPESAPRAGDRFPWLRLKFHARGQREDLFQKLDDRRFNLLVIGQTAPLAESFRLDDILQVHAVPSNSENDLALAAASIASPSYYLLRPDGHIGLAGTLFREADLRQWLVQSNLRLESTTSEKKAMAG